MCPGHGRHTRSSPLMRATASCCLNPLTPFVSKDRAAVVSAARGDKVAWPIATLADGSKSDLSIASRRCLGNRRQALRRPAPGDRKLVRPRTAISRRAHQASASMRPPLLIWGLWICYGGWPDRPGPKQMCVAMEPCTAPVDSLAETGPWSRELSPGQSVSWPMYVDLELI